MTTTRGTIHIDSEEATVQARQQARHAAEALGFGVSDVTRIVTAVSELARNVHLYADEGEMQWSEIRESGRAGLQLVFDDDGPGIPDAEAALDGGVASSTGLGRGLSGTKQLVDTIDIETGPESGTTVTIVKWVP